MQRMVRVWRVLVFVYAIGLSVSAQAGFDECRQFFVNGKSPVIQTSAPSKQRELCFDAFAILHSGQSKTPIYVAERLNRTQLLDARDEKRTNKFYEEARLPNSERARLTDYKNSGFDRGHMAPAADMPNAQAMAQSFSLANMVPQAQENNRGPWAKSVEKPTRQYAMRAAGYVYVFTGPVFEAPVDKVGAGQVWVPKYLYKLVYDPSTNRAWAYWLENTNEARATRPISYEELIRRTGIEFLPSVQPRI